MVCTKNLPKLEWPQPQNDILDAESRF